ncbi:hypothetical protein [Actinopolymorpha alba]|uniref:COG4315 family predicted lipoprotein n=1 Tax=Actinopolymorpha alba TaxID=533267 RepID=UPI000378D215|nr:hypothetical protein [Actinopolymorpha alba]
MSVTDAASPGAAVVKTEEVDGIGKVLVNGSGMALYVNNVDKHTSIKCVTACAAVWRPYTVSVSTVTSKMPGINGTFSIVTRPEKTKQLALNNRPLYTFIQDRRPGMVRGNAFTDTFSGKKFTWHVATATGVMATATASHPMHSKSPTYGR